MIVVTRLYSEEELPAEFKLYLPVQQKGGHQVERQKDTGVESQKRHRRRNIKHVFQGRGEGGAQGGVAPPAMQ